MKKLYLYALVVLSFGMMRQNARSQTCEEIDSVKNWTDDFLKSKLAEDKELRIDTVWITKLHEVENWGKFGAYAARRCSDESCVLPALIIKYLATKLDDAELRDKIALANGVVPGAYNHEDGHRKTHGWAYGKHNHAWSVRDNMQRQICYESAQRLSESFSMRREIMNGRVTKNMLKNIADNMPKSKSYNKDYFLWLANNEISENISAFEANLMLQSLINWMKKASIGGIYFKSMSARAQFYSLDAISDLKDSRQKNLIDWDTFMHRMFEQEINNRFYYIFSLADKSKIDEFLQTIADIMKKYDAELTKQEQIIQEGWAPSIAKLNKKYKKDVKMHMQTKLRSEKFM
jgi:hypothetical protein